MSGLSRPEALMRPFGLEMGLFRASAAGPRRGCRGVFRMTGLSAFRFIDAKQADPDYP